MDAIALLERTAAGLPWTDTAAGSRDGDFGAALDRAMSEREYDEPESPARAEPRHERTVEHDRARPTDDDRSGSTAIENDDRRSEHGPEEVRGDRLHDDHDPAVDEDASATRAPTAEQRPAEQNTAVEQPLPAVDPGTVAPTANPRPTVPTAAEPAATAVDDAADADAGVPATEQTLALGAGIAVAAPTDAAARPAPSRAAAAAAAASATTGNTGSGSATAAGPPPKPAAGAAKKTTADSGDMPPNGAQAGRAAPPPFVGSLPNGNEFPGQAAPAANRAGQIALAIDAVAGGSIGGIDAAGDARAAMRLRAGGAAARSAVEQISARVATAARKGVDRISIQLQPPELGRVAIKIEIGQDGKLTAQITAERGDTLDLLQRDARSLERALNQTGLRTDSDSLSFNLRGEEQSHHKAFAHEHDRSVDGQPNEAIRVDPETAVAATLRPRDGSVDGRLDIRV